jgi:hypothetical protein
VLGRSIVELRWGVYSALFVITAAFSVLSGGQYLARGVSLFKLRET